MQEKLKLARDPYDKDKKKFKINDKHFFFPSSTPAIKAQQTLHNEASRMSLQERGLNFRTLYNQTKHNYQNKLRDLLCAAIEQKQHGD